MVRDRGGQGEFIEIGRETSIKGKWELNLGREMGTEFGIGNGVKFGMGNGHK